ncbi:MAG: hypothetical protein SGPRY_009982, partial [Prymnesium sp.]
SSSLHQDAAAAANAAGVRSGRGGQDGDSSRGAPYVEYEQDSEDEDHTAKAAALVALTSRVEAQVERRLKSKMDESSSSAILALQQDLTSMASTAAAKEKAAEEKIAALQAELERHSWASEGFSFPDPSERRGTLTRNAAKTFGEPMTEAAKVIGEARKLVQRLAGLAYAQLEVADMEAAEGTVLRHLLGSVRHFDGRAGYTKLSAVHTRVAADDSEGLELRAGGVLLLLDKQFVSPTQVERDRELAAELDKIKSLADTAPSRQIALSERSTRSFTTNMLLDAGFSGASLDDWLAQFRIYEKQPGFVEAFAAARRGGEALPTKPTKGVRLAWVNVLLGGYPREFDSEGEEGDGEGGAADFMRKVAINPLGLMPGDLGKPKGNNGDDAVLLRRLIAAVTREQKNEQWWVEAHGVPGFAAPSYEKREPLHIGKIAAALGIKLSN